MAIDRINGLAGLTGFYKNTMGVSLGKERGHNKVTVRGIPVQQILM